MGDHQLRDPRDGTLESLGEEVAELEHGVLGDGAALGGRGVCLQRRAAGLEAKAEHVEGVAHEERPG